MTRDFIVLKIDQDRMTNGKKVAAKLRGERSSGIPWMVILDAGGKQLITSDGPKGNCGCPVQPHEVAHFVKMLETTRRTLSDSDIAAVKKSLDSFAAKILGKRRARTTEKSAK
jgi:hypothetical protein